MDFEWTKNYKIKNGNKPFCFSFVFCKSSDLLNGAEDKLMFDFILNYIENFDEIPILINNANSILKRIMEKNYILVGHQLSSDISVAINNSKNNNSDNIKILRAKWKKRKNAGIDTHLKIFDTRFDLGSFLIGKSRRLVDVCQECNLDVTQPELKSSMTKMQNIFFEKHDLSIMEKLSVLNIRHSLSSTLLYHLYSKQERLDKCFNVNKALFNNLRKYFI